MSISRRSVHRPSMYSGGHPTWVLLILLLGKYNEYSHVLAGSQISNSHFFFPLSSNRGRDEKSNSQVSAVGGAGVVLSGSRASGLSTRVSALSAIPENALHNRCSARVTRRRAIQTQLLVFACVPTTTDGGQGRF